MYSKFFLAIALFILCSRSLWAISPEQVQGSWEELDGFPNTAMTLSEDGGLVWMSSLGPLLQYRVGSWAVENDVLVFSYKFEHDIKSDELREEPRVNRFQVLSWSKKKMVIRAGEHAPELEFKRRKEPVVYSPPSKQDMARERQKLYIEQCKHSIDRGVHWQAAIFCSVAGDEESASALMSMGPVVIPDLSLPMPDKMLGHWCVTGVGMSEDDLAPDNSHLYMSKESAVLTASPPASWDFSDDILTLRSLDDEGKVIMTFSLRRQDGQDVYMDVPLGGVWKLHAGVCPKEALEMRYVDIWSNAFVMNASEVMEYLLVNNLGLHGKSSNYKGDSALTTALSRKRVDWARRMLDAGADINHRTSSGETALDIADRLKLTEMAELLRQKGAVSKGSGF